MSQSVVNYVLSGAQVRRVLPDGADIKELERVHDAAALNPLGNDCRQSKRVSMQIADETTLTISPSAVPGKRRCFTCGQRLLKLWLEEMLSLP